MGNIKKNKRINDLIKDCTNYQNMVQTLENENRVLQLKLDSIEFKKNAEAEEDNPEGKIPNLLERLRNTEIYINDLKRHNSDEVDKCKQKTKYWQDKLIEIENKQNQIIKIKDEHIQTLTDAFNSIDPTFEEVLRAEMQALKSSYEFQMSDLHAQTKKRENDYKHKLRKLEMQSSEEKRCWEMRIKLLEMKLENVVSKKNEEETQL